jgi:hypothetical protein
VKNTGDRGSPAKRMLVTPASFRRAIMVRACSWVAAGSMFAPVKASFSARATP